MATRHAFERPHCGGRTAVDGAVRELLVADGWVSRGRSVPVGAFSPQ